MPGSRVMDYMSFVGQSDKAKTHHDAPLDVIETSGVIDERSAPN